MDLPLLAELQRRRVFRALVGYGIAAFALLQVIEPIMHGLHWPESVLSYVVVALAVGFPIVVGLAWIFDVTAGRIERTGPTASRGPKGVGLALLLVGIGVLAAAPAVIWYFAVRRIAAPAESSSSREGVRPSIAVLPFADMSAGKDQEYFSDGIAEEILDNLARVEALRVIGRTSSFSFKGKGEDLRAIGEKLGVGHILQGSVRSSGERIRVTAQLIDASDGSHLWSETYDRNLTDVFAVQDEIAKAVVGALKLTLLPGAFSTNVHPPRDAEAYRQYLLGRSLLLLGTEDGARRASAALEKAVALDPSYAPAWERLAIARGNAALGAAQAEVARRTREAFEAVDRAIALEPDYSGGYVVRGWLRSGSWDWDGALKDMERARSLGPNALVTLHAGAVILHRVGRLKEAIAAQRKAVELEPLGAGFWANLGSYLLEDGQLEEARSACAKALEISPQNMFAVEELAIVDLLEGHAAAALGATEKLSREVDRLVGMAMAHHDLGHAQESQRALDLLRAKGDAEADIAYRIASVNAWRGDADGAFEWLDRAYARREPRLRLVKVDPLLRNLRGDARYTAFLEKMNLPVDR